MSALSIRWGVGVTQVVPVAQWGPGVFAAAAASGRGVHVLEWLTVAVCLKDNMGLKALQVAVDSGRAEVVYCCFADDVFAGNDNGVHRRARARNGRRNNN